MLENFNAIKLETPVDKIITQMRDLITSGQLAPGNRLPAERKLAERLGVSRMHVRDAIKKLEFYGILKTMPQSGTVVAGLGITALDGLITDVLKLEKGDFASLVETRVLLDVNSARLAAERRTDEDIISLTDVLEAYEKKIKQGQPAVEEDLLFHLKIAEVSKNSVLKSLMLIITPDILGRYAELKVCTEDQNQKVIKEHRLILDHIIAQNGAEASKYMQLHLQDVVDFSKANKFI